MDAGEVAPHADVPGQLVELATDGERRACDYAVNAFLADDGFRLPPNALLDPALGDASAEAIYNRLPSSQAAGPDSGFPLASTTSGADSASRPAPSNRNDSMLPPDSGDAPAAFAVSGPAAPSSADTFGEVRDLPCPQPPTPVQQEAVLAQHAVLIAALAQQARAAGRDNAGAKRATTAAAEITPIDWRALLVEFLTARHTQDYSWRRPNPRFAPLGIFLPILEPAAPGRVAFVVDTSGSVPAATLDAVTAELEAYLLQYPTATLDVVYADAKVTGRVSFTAADIPLRLDPVGGGGTDFGPALAVLSEADEPPACVIYLTDLEGRFPGDPPPMPVLWLVFGQPHEVAAAPFGRVVLLPY